MLSFDARILNTNGAKSAPFLVYYLATQHTTCCQQFVKHCLERLRSRSMPSVLRCSYVAYLSSFLARCKILPIDTIVNTIVSLIEECEDCARKADQHILQKDNFIFDQDLMDDNSSSAEHPVSASLTLLMNVHVFCVRFGSTVFCTNVHIIWYK